ncbi:T9SS type A sorting domain-containing protein [uncultured Bacteroides sp.]|mgnify:CR=1 FL=1|uniref:InlB B-repeat-containing protein n=1 Tax=uncultured Bacteroides sp. TaxID=162156 RepID=UPI00262BACD0|nr:T9SS type A sorting domain-containing protein [uncultured Bacteroides sp.]
MKYIFSLFIVLWSITAWGQEGEGGFNPSNPAEPGQRYNLTIQAIPDGAGSTSPQGKQQYALGETVYFSAYPNNGYQFIGWEENGDTISRERYFNFTMPARNTTLNAVFKAIEGFNPENPDEPSPEAVKYKLTLAASPAEGGRFNLSAETAYSAGKEVSLYAYPNSNYQFEGWKQGDQLLSTESPYTFSMGKEDVQITGVFRFNPANPGNPGANHWNAETGELIVDDFAPGRIMDAVDQVIGGSGNRSQVSMIIVSGQMESYDFGVADYMSNCTLLDLSRTGGYTQIPNYAFDNTNLNTIILPACTEHISYYAFGNNQNLTDITCYALTPPTVEYNTFADIAEGVVVHVLASAIPLYAEAEGWKDFTILPLTEDVKSLEVSLPEGSEGMYKNMTLELQNQQNGQKQRYVVSDRLNYTFNGLLKNCTYHVYLKTPTDVVLGKIENIEIKEEDLSVSFNSLLALLNVDVKVQTPDNTDVSGQVQITWLDSKKAYLSQGNQLKSQTTGTELIYRIVLNQDLGMQYVVPEDQTFTVEDKDTVLTYTLTPLQMVTISGQVKNANGSALSGATVSVSQKLNGKYSKSFIGQTDAKGQFSMQVFNDQSTIAISATDCISQTLEMVNFNDSSELGIIQLKDIAGATLNLNMTYTASVTAGTEATTEDWYSDYANVAYSIYNETQQKDISNFVVQYPTIVLLDEVAESNKLKLTASSKNNAFEPVTTTATIDANLEATATIAIVELGGIEAAYQTTDNTAVTAMLYDSKGELLKKYNYSNGTLSIPNLASDTYTLVSMSSSDFFNSILKLSALEASGLTEGTDYIKNEVTVKSGIISQVNNENIPTLDESKLYYTGENTSFTVNKASIVAGNYLTLKGLIDFKAEYAAGVSNVQLLVDLPESCSFVENSVMVGSQISAYTIDGNRLTIALDNYNEQVRFCVIPTAGGTYTPNAFVEFTLNEKTVQQPIGSAYYEVKDLSISVPKTVAKSTVPINGTAQGNSEVRIYDNDILIGQTTTLANGVWTATCELNEPYNLSTHRIYAEVTTKQGLELQSETQEVMYDMNAIQVSKVTLYHDNPEMGKTYEVVFDFMNPTSEAQKYIYYIYNKKFTFTIDFTNNDPKVVSNVVLYVKTGDGSWHPLTATYDEKKDIWVASGEFGNMYDGHIPVNVSVDYDANTQIEMDTNEISTVLNSLTNDQNDIITSTQELESLQAELNQEIEKDEPNWDRINYLENEIELLVGISYTKEEEDEDTDISDEEIELLIEECDSLLAIDINQLANGFISLDLYNDKIYTEYLKGTSIKHCTGLKPEQLIASGYTAILKTDGTQAYQLQTDTIFSFVDFESDIYITVDLREQQKTTRSISSIYQSTCDLVDDANNKIESFFQEVRQLTSIISSTAEDITKRLTKQNKALKKDIRRVRNARKITRNKAKRKQLNTKYDDLNKTLNRNKKIIKFIEKHSKTIFEISKGSKLTFGAFDILFNANDMLKDLGQTCKLARSIPEECENDKANANRLLNNIHNWAIGASAFYTSQMGLTVFELYSVSGGLAGAIPSGGTTLTAVGAAIVAAGASYAGGKIYKHYFDKAMSNIGNEIKALKCKKDDPPKDTSPKGQPSGSTDLNPGIDPSGYVYEAVETNRLPGVTATCYYKEMVEDMYGDLHEQVVLWDAAEYAQENPLFTDENGMYRWDVPQGLWQVKFEKEGYQTTYSEWLPVPPPQLEVNVGMVQTSQPYVATVRGYETGIEVDFSKFMLPETMTPEFISITRNGEAVSGEVTFKNAEANPTDKSTQYVSKVRFVPAEALATTDKVVLTVSKRVKSYAGIQMESDFSQEIPIEKEPKAVMTKEIEVVYNGTAELTVAIDPAETAAGKKVTALSASSVIASIEPAEATLNEEGKAVFTITGELPGQTMIQFSVENTNIKPEVKVNVVEAGAQNITQRYTLAAGWNWISVNVQAENLNDLPTLLSPIKEATLTVKGADSQLVNNGESGWEGELSSLTPTQAYKIKMQKDAVLELNGKAAVTNENTITLSKGWNWIGYVSSISQTLEDALQNLQAEKNDVIKGEDSFAVYDGTAWKGSLRTLTPGKGYMYYSQAVKSFNYATGSETMENTPTTPQWEYDAHLSEDNMVIVAQLYNGEQQVTASTYIIGIFAGDECRGIAVEEDRLLYICAHGEPDDEKLTLRAYDVTGQKEYDIQEEVTWSNALTGTPEEPLKLHVGELTGIIPVYDGVLIYPSPVRNRLYIRDDIQNIEEVRISNMSGQTLIVKKQVQPLEGIAVSTLNEGFYFISIKTADGIVQQKFMKKN